MANCFRLTVELERPTAVWSLSVNPSPPFIYEIFTGKTPLYTTGDVPSWLLLWWVFFWLLLLHADLTATHICRVLLLTEKHERKEVEEGKNYSTSWTSFTKSMSFQCLRSVFSPLSCWTKMMVSVPFFYRFRSGGVSFVFFPIELISLSGVFSHRIRRI